MTHSATDGLLRRISARVLFVFVSLVVAVGACEIALRVARFSYPLFHMPDDETGSRPRPGADGWYVLEGRAHVKVNRDGLRDVDHERLKPVNTVRIVILGDSYAEALQIPIESTFWAILGRELAACRAFGDRMVEVINFGVSGYSTTQELLALRSRGWSYDPDIVLLAFLTGNDISDNSKALSENLSGMNPRPFFVRIQDNLASVDTQNRP